jgi:hypothetical protein
MLRMTITTKRTRMKLTASRLWLMLKKFREFKL